MKVIKKIALVRLSKSEVLFLNIKNIIIENNKCTKATRLDVAKPARKINAHKEYKKSAADAKGLK